LKGRDLARRQTLGQKFRGVFILAANAPLSFVISDLSFDLAPRDPVSQAMTDDK